VTTIHFLYGSVSKPGGLQPTDLTESFLKVIDPALVDHDFEAAARTAHAAFDQHQSPVVVGSSRDGAVAMNINTGEARLVRLSPTGKNWGNSFTIKPGTMTLHSRADDSMSPADSEELAKDSGAKLFEPGSDHRLADPPALAVMLSAWEELE